MSPSEGRQFIRDVTAKVSEYEAAKQELHMRVEEAKIARKELGAELRALADKERIAADKAVAASQANHFWSFQTS